MSQKGDIIVLAPGAAGWEAWSGPPAGPFQPAASSDSPRAGDFARLPSGDLVMLFPVRAVTSVPFRSATADDELFDDLAGMHLERLGLRPDANAGQLIDSFLVARGDGHAQLLTVVLRAPGEGDLPPRSPKEFDLSARAFPLPEHSVALWREFGRWVFAVGGAGGALAYAQATPCDDPAPDDSVAAEIGLALTQLALQGIQIQPRQVVMWVGDEAAGHPEALEAAFPRRVTVAQRPPLELPTPRSKLLPEDVRAARRERLRHQRRVALAAVAALAYLGLIGWLGFGLWSDVRDARSLSAEAAALRPVAEEFESHRSRWDELAPVVDVNEWPVELLHRCVRQISPNSGLRLQTAELSSDDSGRIKQIRLVGEAAESEPIGKFSLALQRHDLLAVFRWEVPQPQQTNKGTWSFTFTGGRQDIPNP